MHKFRPLNFFSYVISISQYNSRCSEWTVTYVSSLGNYVQASSAVASLTASISSSTTCFIVGPCLPLISSNSMRALPLSELPYNFPLSAFTRWSTLSKSRFSFYEEMKYISNSCPQIYIKLLSFQFYRQDLPWPMTTFLLKLLVVFFNSPPGNIFTASAERLLRWLLEQ